MGKIIIDEKTLKKLYLEDKKTDKEIASIFGCNKQTVYETRKRFKISAIPKTNRYTVNLTCVQYQLIYGSLLGDASISHGIRNGKQNNSCIEFKQGPLQKEYLFWKYDILKNLCVSKPQQLKNNQWRFRTFHHPIFSKLRTIWYPNGKKIVPLSVLKKMNIKALAVWFMDDGTLCKSSNHMKLCTCSFSMDEHLQLQKWLLDKFAIQTEIKQYGGYLFLVIHIDSRKNFVTLIKEEIISTMRYKITFREFHKWNNI